MFFVANTDFPSGLFLKDPLQSKLGKSIIQHSIILMDEVGFESFTFRKLAQRMGSNETSLYRYFENKHMLLLYLVVWYWNWVGFLIDINIRNVNDPSQKLDIIIDNIVNAAKTNPSVDFVDEQVLHRIIIAESSKAYHTKNIDEENRHGFFLTYKTLVQKVADVILEVKQDFPYPHSFATTLFEMANTEIYCAEHLPRLSDIQVQNQNYDGVVNLLKFYKDKLLS